MTGMVVLAFFVGLLTIPVLSGTLLLVLVATSEHAGRRDRRRTGR